MLIEAVPTSCFLAAQQSPHLWHTMHCTRSGCSLKMEDVCASLSATSLTSTDLALRLKCGCSLTDGWRLHSSLGPMILSPQNRINLIKKGTGATWR